MPQRTVYIPDDLDAQAKPLIDERKINLSNLTQAALEREVRRLSPFSLDEESVSRSLDRLKEERQLYQDEWRERGKALALQWASRASYAQLAGAAKLADSPEKTHPVDTVIGVDLYDPEIDAESWIEDRAKTYPALAEMVTWGGYHDQQIELRHCADSSFVEGWASALKAFWNRLKEAK